MPAFMIRMESACVAEQRNNRVRIEHIENRSIVSLKVSSKSLASAREKLQLASPLCVASGDPRSHWIGPYQWLLLSDSMTPRSIIRNCEETLAETVHNAVDYSSGLAVLRIASSQAGQILATGSGIDFRPGKFPIDTCCRTRLAQIAVVIVAETPDQFDLYVDRSYGTYLNNWLTEASEILVHAGSFQGLRPFLSELLQ